METTKKQFTVKCRICDGAGVLSTCSCRPNDPRCCHPEGDCETCEGHGEYDLCVGCEEAPVDERFGPELCEGCAKSCPVCEQGTSASGVICQWCLEQEQRDGWAHEQAHAAGRV